MKDDRVEAHYIALAGMYGCIPNVCEVHDSPQDAVDSMAMLHQLGKKRTNVLRRDWLLVLNLKRDGNEYVEIVECFCDKPEEHRHGIGHGE